MKTAVVMTMFRTINQGSALQTYALHTKLQELGYHCVTIDYPRQAGAYLEKFSFLGLVQKLVNYVVYRRRDREYNKFLKKELNLTRPYWTPEALQEDPPKGDLYVTGSDQTFNATISTWDPSYMLSFVKKNNGARKIAYAASFATGDVPEKWRGLVPKLLNEYNAVSTREEKGVEIFKRQTGRDDGKWCCDPTMLFEREEWKRFAEKATHKIRKPYILAYLLNYAVNPYPEVDRLVKEAQDATGYEVIYLLGRKKDLGKPNSRIIKNANTYEFVDLFLNAAMIITSSFHGAAFSVQSGNPFMAIVHHDANVDNRVRSLMTKVGAVRNIVDAPIADNVHFESLSKWQQAPEVADRLAAFREESFNWLKEAVG